MNQARSARFEFRAGPMPDAWLCSRDTPERTPNGAAMTTAWRKAQLSPRSVLPEVLRRETDHLQAFPDPSIHIQSKASANGYREFRRSTTSRASALGQRPPEIAQPPRG